MEAERYEHADGDDDEFIIDKYAKKLKQRSQLKVWGSRKQQSMEFKTITPVGSRKRIRKRGVLSIDEQLDITFRILCQNEKQADFSKEYCVTNACICNVFRRSRKDPKYISELLERRNLKAKKREQISKVVLDMCHRREFVDSTSSPQSSTWG